VLLDVEVLDGAGEEFFFCRHDFYRISILARTDAGFRVNFT
jgi:hypothetical protein